MGAHPHSGSLLPDRIELSTSRLPSECSTTELRQRRRGVLPANAPPCTRFVCRPKCRVSRETVILSADKEIPSDFNANALGKYRDRNKS